MRWADTGAVPAVQVGLAQMLKGGVIMDVTNVEEARIAEEAGAVAVMALERVPADIRRDGGVARMRCGIIACTALVYYSHDAGRILPVNQVFMPP